MKVCALFILVSASYALAAVERYPPEEKPQEFAGQEGCYLKKANKVFPYDTRVNADDGSCTQYLCSKSSGEIQIFSCGAVLITYGCETVLDTTKSYPDCCPKEQCDATTSRASTAPTDAASSTTPFPSTRSTPSTPSTTPSPAAASGAVPGSSYASAYAKSESGKPPVTQSFATPGAFASASAT